MRTQYESMWLLYSTELTECEASFMKEWIEILDKNWKEIDALFEKHRTKEDDYIEKWAELESDQA